MGRVHGSVGTVEAGRTVRPAVNPVRRTAEFLRGGEDEGRGPVRSPGPTWPRYRWGGRHPVRSSAARTTSVSGLWSSSPSETQAAASVDPPTSCTTGSAPSPTRPV